MRFSLALLAVLLFPRFLPGLHLLFFAPYIVSIFYTEPRYKVLWKSLGCGVIIDLLCSTPCFGIMALNYTLCSFVLYKQKQNFFEDKLSTLPLMTCFFSILSSVVALGLAPLFGQEFVCSPRFIVTDLLEMPICDGVYAFVLFVLPFHLTKRISKLKLYALIWKRNRSRPS